MEVINRAEDYSDKQYKQKSAEAYPPIQAGEAIAKSSLPVSTLPSILSNTFPQRATLARFTHPDLVLAFR
jgi:hypothetical protein